MSKITPHTRQFRLRQQQIKCFTRRHSSSTDAGLNPKQCSSRALSSRGACSVTDPDLCPLWVARGLEYHIDIKGQGESFEQLVIFHQPDLYLMCLNSIYKLGCSWG